MKYFKVIHTLSVRKKLSVYLVGGFLRDQILNRSGCDFDFAVSKNAIALAKSFSRAIQGAFVLLDEDHPCGRVVKKEQGQIWTFDFSDFRAPTLEKDLGLRDFTVNTLSLSLEYLDGPKIDFHKVLSHPKALKDLKSKTVRLVSSRVFIDDPLRLMRAFSLFAQLGFKIEAKTFRQIQNDAHLINKVSMERIREEWFKVLSSSRTYEALLLMHKAKLLERIIPQLSVMEKIDQGGYHHLDVWHHSLEVVKQFEELISEIKVECIQDYLNTGIAAGHKRCALLKFACLVHDIGKPDTKKIEGQRMTFYSHEHVGAAITRIIAKQMKLSVKERHFLEDMVTWHLRPGYVSNFKKPSERMIFRFLRDTKEEALSVLLLALADQRATRGVLTTKAKFEHHQKTCWQVIDRFIENKKQKPRVRLITGDDLIKKLKLKPSPLFAKILNSVQEAHALGKISSKSEALALAMKMSS